MISQAMIDESDLPDQRPPRGPALAWALAVVVAAASLAPMLIMPLTRDQGHYAYAGQVILDGKLPYRDMFDAKGPSIYYSYALAMALFGQSEVGVRIFFYLAALAGAVLAGMLGRRLAGRIAIVPATFIYALAAVQGNSDAPWFTAEAEDLILPLTLGAIVLIGSARRLRGPGRVFGAGLLLGLTFTFKPTVLPACGLMGIVAVWHMVHTLRLGWSGVAGRVLAAAGGFVLPMAAYMAYFAAVGVLQEFLALLVGYNRSYAGIRLGRDITDLVRFAHDGRWRGLAVLALAAGLLLRPAVPAWGMLWAFLVGAWAAVVWQGKFFVYQWTPVIGTMAVLAGAACGALAQAAVDRLRRPAAQWAAAGVALLLLPVLAGPSNVYFLNRMFRSLKDVAHGERTVRDCSKGLVTGASTAQYTYEVADHLRANTQPGQTVQIWGYEVLINFLADRRSPTRFVLDFPLSEPGPLRDAWRQEFMRDLRTGRPAYVIVVYQDDESNQFASADASERLKEFGEFDRYLAENYSVEKRIERFELRRRNDLPPAQAPLPPGAGTSRRSGG